VVAADVLVLAGPIWLGDNSSVTKRVIERLYGCSALLNDQGQYAYYGRVGGCLGSSIPPQADAGWIGPVGPGLRQPAHRLGRRHRTRTPEP
jgi:hypothetical protein